MWTIAYSRTEYEFLIRALCGWLCKFRRVAAPRAPVSSSFNLRRQRPIGWRECCLPLQRTESKSGEINLVSEFDSGVRRETIQSRGDEEPPLHDEDYTCDVNRKVEARQKKNTSVSFSRIETNNRKPSPGGL